MKHSMPQRPLSFVKAQAYDLSYQDAGRRWVASSAEHYSLDEPIGARRGHDGTACADAETSGIIERPFIDADTGAVCTNPFRDEPGELAVGTVKRLGLVGLVTVAVGSGLARWWHSFSSHDH
jgi:hypothetical protein